MEQRHDGDERGDLPRSAVIARMASLVSARAAVVQAEMEPGVRGQLYKSFGDGYTRAFELAMTPALCGLFGYWLDSWLGILPVLTIVFPLVAFVTLLARTWYEYVQKMEDLEGAGPWARRPEPPPVPAPDPGPVPAPAPEAAT